MNVQKFIDGLYGVQTDINIQELRDTSHIMHYAIKEYFKNSRAAILTKSTDTTKLFNSYNLLLYPFPILHKLYFNISKCFHLIYQEHFGKSVDESFFIQCWLNSYKKGEFIDWHGHQPSSYQAWHGFICVDTEPNSYTSYKWPKNSERTGIEITVPSKDGLLVLGQSNDDMHRCSEWHLEDRNRITIAFDIVPSFAFTENYLLKDVDEPKYLSAMKANNYYVNHWIPI